MSDASSWLRVRWVLAHIMAALQIVFLVVGLILVLAGDRSDSVLPDDSPILAILVFLAVPSVFVLWLWMSADHLRANPGCEFSGWWRWVLTMPFGAPVAYFILVWRPKIRAQLVDE